MTAEGHCIAVISRCVEKWRGGMLALGEGMFCCRQSWRVSVEEEGKELAVEVVAKSPSRES